MTIKVTYNVTDVYMSQSVSPVYINVSYSDGSSSGGGVWGSITGTLSNQTDLQTALDLKVPYTGATGNVDLGEYELKAGQVEFDQTPTGSAGVGVMRWNDADGTVDLGLKGGNVTLQVGQEQVARVVNKTGANLLESEYKVVKVSSAQGQRLAVDLAQANNDNNSADTLGIVTENIDNNQEGFITTMGTIRGINTTGSLQGETWTDGDVLYLSGTTAGAITNVKPTAPLHIVVVGYVEYAHSQNGKIFVKVMNGWEIDELHNVLISSPTNNQGLFYNSTSTLWENKSITTALGYTPVPTTRNITINGVTYDLSADRTWTIAAGISGSGASGQVTYWTGASAVSGSNNLFWDNTNGRLGIGTNAPTQALQISNGSILLTDGFPVRYGSHLIYGSGSGIDFGISGFTLGMRLTANRNLILQNGGTFIDNGQRLQVYGDTLLRGSGATFATSALKVQNTNSIDILTVQNGGNVIIGEVNTVATLYISSVGDTRFEKSTSGTNGLQLYGPSSASHTLSISSFNSGNYDNGALSSLRFNGNYVSSAGSTAFSYMLINGTINQTGSTSITRGLYVNPTLTAAADFRAIETTAGNVLFGSNFFWDNTNNRLGIGTNVPARQLVIYDGASGVPHVQWANASTGVTNADGFQIRLLSTNQVHFTNFENSAMYFGNQGITGQMTLYPSGNLAIGTSASDGGQRLQVIGDTLLRGSGATSATTALTVQDSAGVDMLIMRNDGLLRIVKRYINTSQDLNVGFGASNDGNAYNAAGLGQLFSTANRTSAGVNYAFFGGNITNTSGAFYHLRTTGIPNFAPTSGTGTFFILSLEATINQTGGANGITRGLYVNPTLTAAADFRAIEVSAGVTVLAPSVTARASLRIPSGTAPTSPVDGDIWFDGTNIQMRIGGVTKTFTLI